VFGLLRTGWPVFSVGGKVTRGCAEITSIYVFAIWPEIGEVHSPDVGIRSPVMGVEGGERGFIEEEQILEMAEG
jgi:hypothetical protein